ncbi:MAG: hypothetical protein HYV27_02110 [Candidatus Hydrogenedentes bacterium]|nr:hypothetical protein [Candidatus Hydrogenedentota bacterium]
MKFPYRSAGAAALVALIGASLTGCARTEASPRIGDPEAVALSDLVMVPAQGIESLPFGASKDTLIQELGLPERDYGATLEYRAHGFSAVYCPSRKHLRAVNLSAIPTAAHAHIHLRTAEGIQLGSTASEVVAAYGEPEHETSLLNGFRSMQYYTIGARFGISDGVVTHMSFVSNQDVCLQEPG